MLNNAIAVIIVNYGTAELTIDAAESVLSRHNGGRSVEVHIVDNASPGNCARILQDWRNASVQREKIFLYLECKNHGFGRANNIVLNQLSKRKNRPSFVMFLNPDAVLKNEAVDILAQKLETTDGAVMVGAGICKPDGTLVTSAFRSPSGVSEFVSGLGFGPLRRLLRRWEVPLPPKHPGGPVDWVSGASMMARFEALEGCNFFDPDFFLYFEEVELMHRLRKAGGCVIYVPEARVIHAEGTSTGIKRDRIERSRLPAYWYRSWRLYFLKTRGRAGAFTVALARLSGALLGFPLAWLRGRPSHLALNFVGDFWTHSMLPLFGAESSRRD